MPYTDFTLESVETEFALHSETVDLFAGLEPLLVSNWLAESLYRGQKLALLSEKARSEFLVAPVLIEARELTEERFTFYSGHQFNVDPERNLIGECDFILALTGTLPRLRAPIATILEAKRHDIDGGLGQCVAQMVAARIFNERAGTPVTTIWGCVTTGENWRFLRLRNSEIEFHSQTFYIDNPGLILAAIVRIIDESCAVLASSAA